MFQIERKLLMLMLIIGAGFSTQGCVGKALVMGGADYAKQYLSSPEGQQFMMSTVSNLPQFKVLEQKAVVFEEKLVAAGVTAEALEESNEKIVKALDKNGDGEIGKDEALSTTFLTMIWSAIKDRDYASIIVLTIIFVIAFFGLHGFKSKQKLREYVRDNPWLKFILVRVPIINRFLYGQVVKVDKGRI